MTITRIDRRRASAGNVKPAPACITPDLVARILDLLPPRETPEPSATLIPFPSRPTGAAEPELAAPANSGELVLLAGRGSKNDRAENWRPDEDERLRRAYADGERIDLVAKELGRTVKATYTRAKKIGLSHPRDVKGGFVSSPIWKEAEDEILRQFYGDMPMADLVAKLGRSKTAIFNRAHVLGLQHGYHRAFTRTELKALKIGFERGLAIHDVAKAMGRKPFSLSKYATRHGYEFGRRPLLAQPITLESILALADPSTPLPALVPTSKPDRSNARKTGGWSEERKTLFLDALRQTGLVKTALVEIGLGPSSNQSAHRMARLDPAFGNAWAAIVAGQRAARKQARETKRKQRATLKRTNRTTPRARRAVAQVSAWDDDRKSRFIAALAATGTVSGALESVGLAQNSTQGALAARRADPAFAARWEATVAQVKRARAAASEARRAAERADAQAARAARQHAARDPQIEAALRAQAARRRTATLAAGPRLSSSRQGAAAFTAQRQQDEIAARDRRLADPIEQAKVFLQRKGRIVYRASVVGGAEDRWFVSGCGADVTDQALIDLALQRGMSS